MLDGWIWSDEEILSSPLEFAGGDEDDEEDWDENVDLSLEWDDEEDVEDVLEEDWDEDDEDDEDEEDEEDEDWEEWEDEFDDDDEDVSLGRRRASRHEWN